MCTEPELDNLESIFWLLITINVPDVCMSRYIMVLRRARSITRGIGMGGHWKSRLFGPLNGYEQSMCHVRAKMALASLVAISGPKKSQFRGPTPS